MKTIKQIAEELGVSKQAIRKHISKLPPTTVSTGANRAILINARGEKIIKEKIKSKVSTVGSNLPPTDTLIKTLNEQIQIKDKQIETLMKQNENMQILLKEQQDILRLQNDKPMILRLFAPKKKKDD